MSLKRRKILHTLIALAVLALSALVSFHSHADPAKVSGDCATCLCGTQLRCAGPADDAADIAAPVFDHFHLQIFLSAPFVVRFSGPRPARAPPLS
jgi:hypothetical protein